VARNLETAEDEDLYYEMVGQFVQARGFFLETIVVLITVIELAYLFKGKRFQGAASGALPGGEAP
jgi:hypothetical protein